jgi:hypothetical protein
MEVEKEEMTCCCLKERQDEKLTGREDEIQRAKEIRSERGYKGERM